MRHLDIRAVLLQIVVAGVALVLFVGWLQDDLAPGHTTALVLKLMLLLGFCLLLSALMGSARLALWARHVRAMETFVAAIPDSEPQFPENGPPEVQALAQRLGLMSLQVRRIVERANLEASRREAILACMAEGVLAVDADLKVTFCNEAFAHAFGALAERVEGRTLLEVVREPALRDILQQTIRTGQTEKQRLRFPMAGSRSFEVRALPLGREPFGGAVIVLHDVTDVEHQEQVRKDFVADVSHELRTPLASIRGFSETLLDGALEDPDHSRKFVEIIHSHAIRLGNIASDLLVLSDLDANKGPIEMQRVAVSEVVESAFHTVASAADQRGIRLKFERCEDCYVLGLRFRLEQVLINLIDNAVKFNRENGEVLVQCEQTDGEVKIIVSDTGIGIPNGELKRIFERFYRVDKARSRPVGGTGLGLPIVKEVIERMGGTVTVDSTLGRGSKFTILLSKAA